MRIAAAVTATAAVMAAVLFALSGFVPRPSPREVASTAAAPASNAGPEEVQREEPAAGVRARGGSVPTFVTPPRASAASKGMDVHKTAAVFREIGDARLAKIQQESGARFLGEQVIEALKLGLNPEETRRLAQGIADMNKGKVDAYNTHVRAKEVNGGRATDADLDAYFKAGAEVDEAGLKALRAINPALAKAIDSHAFLPSQYVDPEYSKTVTDIFSRYPEYMQRQMETVNAELTRMGESPIGAKLPSGND